MFHVKHGQFFTILNHPFTFVNFQMRSVKYYGGKFANVNRRKVLIFSALRQFGAGAFGNVFSPGPRSVARALRVAFRRVRRPSVGWPVLGPGPAPLRPFSGPAAVPPFLVRRPSRPAVSGPWGPSTAPARCVASPSGPRRPRFARRARGPLFSRFTCIIVQNVIYLCPISNLNCVLVWQRTLFFGAKPQVNWARS